MTTIDPATLDLWPATDLEPFALISDEERAGLPDDLVDAYPLTALMADPPGTGREGQAVLSGRYVYDAGFVADRLERAVLATQARFELLRTSVGPDTETLHRVHATAPALISVHDLCGVDDAERQERFAALIAAEAAIGFDPGATPPARFVAIVDDRGWCLLAGVEPALAEVISIDALLRLVLDEYRDEYRDNQTAHPVVRHAPCVDAELGAASDLEGCAVWEAVAERSSPFAVPTAWRREPRSSTPAQVADCPTVVSFADIADGLTALAAQAAVGLSTVLLAAHLKVLSMLAEGSVHSDVVCGPGSPGDGERVFADTGCEEKLHRVVLPFVVECQAGTWREFVTQVRDDERELWQYRHARREVMGERDREPFVHVVFEAQDRPAGTAVAPDGTLVPVHSLLGYGLHVLALDSQVRLMSAGGALSPWYARRLASMYRAVLVAMAADPAGDARAAYLAEGERNLVLSTWSVGETVEHTPATIIELIAARVRANPAAPAVRVGDQILTYQDLEERSNQLAHYLIAAGARVETLVGVCLSRGVDLLPALLAVWKSGAGYLPLDPQLPARRLRQMLDATGCVLAVSTGELAHLIETTDPQPPQAPPPPSTILLDERAAAIAAMPQAAPDVPLDGASLAYVIYTSGSTGVPKGVMVHHAGLLNYLLWTVAAYAAHGTGGAPVFSSISFDLGIPSLFTPLLTGQCVHLLPEPLDVAELGDRLDAGGPYSFIKMTPGHLDLLTHQLDAGQISRLAGIVIGAGDSFTTALAQRWHDLAGPGGTIVATEYGPTEITIGNSGQPIVDVPETELVPLGVPIPNSTMYILNDLLEPVPIGVAGEVYVGGVGVSRGYLARPDLTADRFVPDPYGAAGARLYRTGDLARWLPDGTVDFLGRMDNQVKIRGYRIELGEIQAILCEHPDVRDAVVIAAEPTPGNKRLVAYLVLTSGQHLDADALRAHAERQLPEYMVPSTFIAIGRIPLTTNGKLDTRALPALL